MRIITISREFGSGGRELGMRLAEALGIPCYDHELIEEVAKQNNMDVEQVSNISERDIQLYYPLTMGRRFASMLKVDTRPVQVVVALQEAIRRFAHQGGCVIVGRCADVILKDMEPLNIFVYADAASKLRRCEQRAPEDEKLSTPALNRLIAQVDKDRAAYRDLFSDDQWGKRKHIICASIHLGNRSSSWSPHWLDMSTAGSHKHDRFRIWRKHESHIKKQDPVYLYGPGHSHQRLHFPVHYRGRYFRGAGRWL